MPTMPPASSAMAAASTAWESVASSTAGLTSGTGSSPRSGIEGGRSIESGDARSTAKVVVDGDRPARQRRARRLPERGGLVAADLEQCDAARDDDGRQLRKESPDDCH